MQPICLELCFRVFFVGSFLSLLCSVYPIGFSLYVRNAVSTNNIVSKAFSCLAGILILKKIVMRF